MEECIDKIKRHLSQAVVPPTEIRKAHDLPIEHSMEWWHRQIALIAAVLGLLLAANAQAQNPLFKTNRTALNILTSNGNILVSWPLWPVASTLEMTPDPQSSAWAAVANSQSATGELVQVMIPAEGSRFFRLNGRNWAPVFQFAAFYDFDLEIGNGPPMTITGPVHANRNIYADPGQSLTFQGRVTAAHDILEHRAPLDPMFPGSSSGIVHFLDGKRSGVEPLRLPIGTNSMRQIVEIPPFEEAPSSALGMQRFYNKADLIILARDSGITAHSGLLDNFQTLIPTNEVNAFVTNTTFFDIRERKTIRAVQIDVAQLRNWNDTNMSLRSTLPSRGVGILYIADSRSLPQGSLSGVRLVNGQMLLPKGLTLVTPNPLYVQANYNCPTVHQGTTNTSATVPAALIADAITILSSNWNDANSAAPITSRIAADTTVNAALMAGIVPTTTNVYSGGLDNFPRLLENWSGKTFTCNGSMVVLWTSRQAVSRWPGTGGVYNPPVRMWSLDTNFRSLTNLPLGTPIVGVIPD